MKKKKLKKKIRKLEEELELVIRDFGEALNNERNRISNLGEKYTKMREDLNGVSHNRSTDLGLIKDACSKADKSQFQINDIYEKLKILKLRTETDYTQFKPLVDTSKGPDDASPTCETCRWNKSEGLFMDSPCAGCTGLKEMYAKKEESNEQRD